MSPTGDSHVTVIFSGEKCPRACPGALKRCAGIAPCQLRRALWGNRCCPANAATSCFDVHVATKPEHDPRTCALSFLHTTIRYQSEWSALSPRGGGRPFGLATWVRLATHPHQSRTHTNTKHTYPPTRTFTRTRTNTSACRSHAHQPYTPNANRARRHQPSTHRHTHESFMPTHPPMHANHTPAPKTPHPPRPIQLTSREAQISARVRYPDALLRTSRVLPTHIMTETYKLT